MQLIESGSSGTDYNNHLSCTEFNISPSSCNHCTHSSPLSNDMLLRLYWNKDLGERRETRMGLGEKMSMGRERDERIEGWVRKERVS